MPVTVSASSQKLSGTENSKRQNQLARILSGHSAVVISQAVGTKSEAPLIAGVSRDQTIKIWNLNSGEVIHTLAGHSLPILALAISRDGKILASAGHDKTIKLWDVTTGSEIRTLIPHAEWVESLAISPDSQ